MKPQLELFEITTPSYHGMTQAEAFVAFHEANPHVYANLLRLARTAWQARPAEKVGMKYLFEILRWEYRVNTERPEREFRLNNNFTAYYARAIMAADARLAGAFETRIQKKKAAPHRTARAG